MKKMVWLIGLAIIVVFFLVGCSKKDSAEPIAWDSALSEAGFTDDEIASYQEVFDTVGVTDFHDVSIVCLLYTSPSPRDRQKSRMPSSA